MSTFCVTVLLVFISVMELEICVHTEAILISAGYFEMESGLKNTLGVYENTTGVQKEGQCAMKCSEQVSCNSYNFNQELKVCELSTSFNVKERLVNKTKIEEQTSWKVGFRKLENEYCNNTVPPVTSDHCASSPCQNSAIDCRPAKCNRDFECICSSGFKGKTCEEIDQLPSGISGQFTATFTNLGTTGREGPISIGNHYDNMDHMNLVTLNAGIQIFTVPYTGQYHIQVAGAAGGNNRETYVDFFGRGAIMKGTFDLTEGVKLKILVGQKGSDCATQNPSSGSAGGGGGTFVTLEDDTPLIIAGGGGGVEGLTAARPEVHGSVSTSGNSGYGGAAWAGGQNGQGASEADSSNSGGGGGGLLSDGRSSTEFGGAFGVGGEGGKSFANGGVGGRAKYNDIFGGFGGGGGAFGTGGGAAGGGGYSGGASGDNNVNSCGGGGGSYNSGTQQENIGGESGNTDHGYVIITKI